MRSIFIFSLLLLVSTVLYAGQAVAARAPGAVRGSSYGRYAPPPPLPRSAPPSHYGSQHDYHRGYVGNRPGDIWHRDADFKARDYQFRHEAPPPAAQAPARIKTLSPDLGRTPSLVIPRLPDESSLPRDSSDIGGRVEREKAERRRQNWRTRNESGPFPELQGRDGRDGR
ncbi:hypothetical protein LJB81_02460 [Desulfovibrio sp. OttesenSCG-928-M14]|nr:hypothetical protein [Desulfovibrio sp. OttesenSCG-928-M14]